MYQLETRFARINIVQIMYSSNNHTIQLPIIDACLPVGYRFPASIPFKEGHDTHTNHSHIPKLLPLTAVFPIIYRSIFEHIYYAASCLS